MAAFGLNRPSAAPAPQLPEVARAIWAAVILAIPFFGVIAYWLVQPGETSKADV